MRNWAVIRHGTRNPSKLVIRAMNTDLYKFKDQIVQKGLLCDADKNLFKDWESLLSEDEEKNLVAEGEDELIDMGERYQKRFPDLLSDRYENSTYKVRPMNLNLPYRTNSTTSILQFKFTATERTERSAKGFATGLFGRQNLRQIWFQEPLHKDPILRFYKLCKRWRKEVKKNPETYVEIERFANTPKVQDMVNALREKTGISTLQFKDIRMIYEVCAFETAWWKLKSSPWCTLFNRESIEMLEYAEDLEYYWKDGYGFEITHSQACPAIKDLVDHLRFNSTQPQSTFYFTHSGTVLKVLAALGLYKDEQQLKHINHEQPRMWRTSEIDAFASNLLFVTFQCQSEEEEQLLFMHQERIVRLPGCPQDRDLCPLSVFVRRHKEKIDNCLFDDICEL